MRGLLAALLCLPGCTWLALTSGVPGVAVEADIRLLAERHRYLDVEVEAGRHRYRFFFPADLTCSEVIESDEARFRLSGMLAAVQTEDQVCDAVGLLSLLEWRDRQGRTARRDGTRSLIPSDRIEYEVVYEDADVFLARGRFRVSGLIGWRGGEDTIAVFPNSEECASVRSRQRAGMEFRSIGRPVFSVVIDRVRCPVLGFAQPQP